MANKYQGKSCLIIYIGNGYSEKSRQTDNRYYYSVDMRDNEVNHLNCIFKPLKSLGFKINVALVTNKHEKYNEFKKYYAAIDIDYDDLTQEDIDCLYHLYYNIRVPKKWGAGAFFSGGRFLRLKAPIPSYDYYIFVRSDLSFKKTINDLDIDFNKINYLWIETDINHFEFGTSKIIKEDPKMFWRQYNRVSGNTLNIVPRFFLNPFLSCMWAEHCSLHLLLKDFEPLITLNDVNFMCSEEKCYATDATTVVNPVFTFNKKILG